MRFFAGLALACALATPAPAASPNLRPYTVEDMLAVQNLGRAVFSGDGKWLAFEVQGPITSAGRFDLEFFTAQRTNRLYVVDVAGGGPARPLLASPVGVGESLGARSPDGRRVVVYRLRDHANELGVLDFADGKVRWTGRSVDLEAWFSLVRWRGDQELVAITTTPQTPSFGLNRGWQSQERTVRAWQAAQAGQSTVSVLKSGEAARENPAWPDAELVAVNAETGAVRSLAHGPFLDLSIAPGGGTAALVTAQEPVVMDARVTAQNGLFDRRRRLTLVDLASGRILVPCPRCDLAATLMSWSPDGRALLVAARSDDARSGDWSDIRYWRLSTSGEARKVSSDLSPGTSRINGGASAMLQPDAGWVAGEPAVLARPSPDGPLGWWRVTRRGETSLLTGLSPEAGRRLAAAPESIIVRHPDGVLRLSGRDVRPLTGVEDRVTSPPTMLGDLPDVLQLASKSAAWALSTTGERTPLAPAPTGASLLALSPPNGAVASALKTPKGVTSLILSQPDRANRTIITLNAGLAEVDLAPPRAIPHRTPRGETVTSWLYLPADHRDHDARPLIVVPYPGANYLAPYPLAAPDFRLYTANVRIMVGAGYAVLTPSLPIPAEARPDAGLADAMLAAVDAALAIEPGLSKTKLAVWGHSFGGFGALTAATQSPRFKAVIASSGISDYPSYWAAQGPGVAVVPEVMMQISTMFGWAESGQGRMLGPPWADPQRYIDASPLFHADRITAPVLLIQGDQDIDPYKSMAMFAALYRQGKPAELLTYLGEGHVVQSPGNVRDVYARALAFLQAALSTVPTSPPARAEPEDASRPSQ